MQIPAMQLQIRDVLSDGTAIASVTRSQGQTFATLEDGRRMICRDNFVLCIDRPSLEKDEKKGPEAPDLFGGPRALIS